MVAGEASADLHAARIVRDLKANDPSLSFVGVGGKHLQGEGMNVLLRSESISLVGLTEIVGRVWELIGNFRKVQHYAEKNKPYAALLIDLPDFNLRLAKHLKKAGVPVIYYISPQIWAWRKSRIHKIKKYVDRMLVLFEFEKTFYEKHGVPVTWVGHPFIDEIAARPPGRPKAERLSSPRFALLPGSRRGEIRHHTPILRELVTRLKKRYPSASFQVPVAPTVPSSVMMEAFSGLDITFSEKGTDAVVRWSDAAVVASGTAVLEVTLTETPMCLYYLLNKSTAFLLRKVWGFDMFIGISNLLMGREIIREFEQEKARADLIAEECQRLIEDDTYRSEQIQALRMCREKLGGKNALDRTTLAIMQSLTMLDSKAPSEGAPFGLVPSHS